MSLDRYRDRAERVVEAAGVVGHHGRENLITGIQQAIQDFVAHDMEWAALAVEEALRQGENDIHWETVRGRVRAAVASIRERGR